MDGYANVQNLHKGKGGWIASATEGGKQVSVLVNQGGVRRCSRQRRRRIAGRDGRC